MALQTSFGNFESLQKYVENLMYDLSSIRTNGAPSTDQLKGAPYLEQWSLSSRQATCLEGLAIGHPILGDFVSVRTSELILFDPTEGWARTRSRYYRLGSQLPTRAAPPFS